MNRPACGRRRSDASFAISLRSSFCRSWSRAAAAAKAARPDSRSPCRRRPPSLRRRRRVSRIPARRPAGRVNGSGGSQRPVSMPWKRRISAYSPGRANRPRRRRRLRSLRAPSAGRRRAAASRRRSAAPAGSRSASQLDVMAAGLRAACPWPARCSLTTLHGSLVGGDDVVPLAERHENVRGHVQRVAGVRRHAAIEPRRPHAERGMDRVVVGMDQVVQHSRVALMGGKDLLEQRRGAHVGGEVAPLVRRAEERQGIESRGVDVVRIALVERGHGVGIEEVPLLLGALPIEDLDGAQVVALALGLAPWPAAPRGWRRAGRGRRAPRRGPAASRPDGCGSSPRPSRPWRNPGSIVCALLELLGRVLDTRSCGAARARAGKAPEPPAEPELANDTSPTSLWASAGPTERKSARSGNRASRAHASPPGQARIIEDCSPRGDRPAPSSRGSPFAG